MGADQQQRARASHGRPLMLGRGFGKEGVDRLARARTERPPLAPAAAAGTTLGARRAVTSGKPLRDMHAASPSTGALY